MDRGAHFYKCDFQVHTPRDQNWSGADAVTDDERRSYAETLIAACRDKQLAGLAITDHHDMAFVQHVRRAAIEEVRLDGTALPDSERITVFPGMELTLGVPCQAIIILDADFPENLFPALQTALNINPVPDSEARNGNVERLHNIVTFSQLHEKLDEYIWLKGRYIILPNVSGEGKFSLLRDGQHGKYASMPCVGGYIDGALEKLKPGFKMRLDGKVKEWGHKRIGCFQTSDNRQEDHGNLGVHTTWVKWAVPTGEALRQACLAQESRISQDEPRLPAITISRIEVSNSTFLGPIDLELNGQYSALIGGRGTGKSTILEYLRWALCDQPPGVSDEDSPNYQARRARLIESTLTALNATVDITFALHDVPHIVRRHSKDGSVMLKIGDAELRACTEGEVRALLPIQAYSQKQLSNVSIRIDELTRFLTAPIRAELASLKARGEGAAGQLRQKYAARQRAQSLAKDLANRDLAARSLQEQAASIQASLTGLTPEDRLTLDREKGYSATSRTIVSWTDSIQPIRDMLAALRQRVETNAAAAASASSVAEPEVFAEVAGDYQSVMNTTASLAVQIDQELDALVTRQADPSSAWGKWSAALDAFKKDYLAAMQRSSAHKERVVELEQINARLNQHLSDTARIHEQLSSLQDVEAQYATERASWIAHREEYDRLMDGQCQVLTQNSAGTIRATIRHFANANAFVERLRDFLSGSNVRRDKLEGIGSAITTAADPMTEWQAVLHDLEMLADFKPDQEGAGQRPNTTILVRVGLSTSDLDKIAARLSSACGFR